MNPEEPPHGAAIFVVGNRGLGCRPSGFAGPDLPLLEPISGSTYGSTVTALSRNGGAFLPIPSEKVRKTAAFGSVRSGVSL